MELNERLSSFLAGRSRRTMLWLIAASVLAIGLFDYGTGPLLSVSSFYLLPVGLAGWYIGGRAGLVTATVCAIAWLVNDLVTNPDMRASLFPFWGAAVRLTTFLLVAHALASLKKSRRRQEELMAFVVHDLRTPVANVMVSLEMVRAAEVSEGPAEVRELAEIGISSGKELLVLIDTLLDLGRLESGKMPMTLEALPVAAVLQEAIQQVEALGTLQKVEIALHVAEEEQVVIADRVLLRRVVVNLLSNAMRYSPPNSTISVEARSEGGGRVQITVSDEGPGIPDAWRAKAFEKYSQVEARKGGSRLGSGLGLAFCRMAVEAQGGEIWLERVEPSGTKVCITLRDGGL